MKCTNFGRESDFLVLFIFQLPYYIDGDVKLTQTTAVGNVACVLRSHKLTHEKYYNLVCTITVDNVEGAL